MPLMDAIILAAGKGTRLRPHTNTIPKPLLPVQGRPILDWIIGALPPVDRLVVVVNYLAEQIEEYLGTQPHAKNWITVRQEEPRGTGDALMSCKGAVTADRVMVLNGGHVVESGITERVIGDPEHPYTRELIADTPTLAGLATVAAAPPVAGA